MQATEIIACTATPAPFDPARHPAGRRDRIGGYRDVLSDRDIAYLDDVFEGTESLRVTAGGAGT